MTREFALCGTYRHVIVIPGCIEHAVVRYTDPTIALLQDDLERMETVR